MVNLVHIITENNLLTGTVKICVFLLLKLPFSLRYHAPRTPAFGPGAQRPPNRYGDRYGDRYVCVFFCGTFTKQDLRTGAVEAEEMFIFVSFVLWINKGTFAKLIVESNLLTGTVRRNRYGCRKGNLWNRPYIYIYILIVIVTYSNI